MNTRQRHILRVLSSIGVGSMAFCVTFFLMLLAETMLLAQLQMDFMLYFQFFILISITATVELLSAIVAAVRYHRNLRTLKQIEQE